MTAPRGAIPFWAVIVVIVAALAVLFLGSRSCGLPPPLGREVAPEDARRRVDPPGRRTTDDGWEVNALPGMPSDASETNPDDYLIRRPQYVVSYNRRHGIPNWVAWHLETSDLGPAERSEFEPDASLPAGFYRVSSRDYRGSDFGRGHMCPSGDRTSSPEDNAATFLMTNIIPQTEDNNRGPWNDFEIACRKIARDGNELFIVAGGSGPFKPVRDGSKLFAPGAVWKIVLVLTVGEDDLARVDTSVRVIAVSMPNIQGIRYVDWKTYRTSVDAIEQATGFDFLAELPDDVESALEASVDTQR